MFNPTALFFVTTPFDKRARLSRLATHVQIHYPNHWHEGTLFISTNRQRTMLKLIMIDSHGIWLTQRKLHSGNFPKIKTNQTELTLTQSQFNWLCQGISFQQVDGINLKEYVL